MDPCVLCPRECRARRLKSETGFCGTGSGISIGHIGLHRGEEPCLCGPAGSGAIFFTGCNARCVFCQNFQISTKPEGRLYSPVELADKMLELQELGAANINLVTPVPQLPSILDALAGAVERGLDLPIVMNTNGYDRVEILESLAGIIDVYLPDFKYGNDLWAEYFSSMPDYTAVCRRAVETMIHQTGKLRLDERGVALKGTIVRHLILPGGFAGSSYVMNTLADIDPSVTVSIMAQFRPCYKASSFEEINRSVTPGEFAVVMEAAERAGLMDIYYQTPWDMPKNDPFFPDFHLESDRVFDVK